MHEHTRQRDFHLECSWRKVEVENGHTRPSITLGKERNGIFPPIFLPTAIFSPSVGRRLKYISPPPDSCLLAKKHDVHFVQYTRRRRRNDYSSNDVIITSFV
ncbi:hypothetical protein OUZ56_027097 [Daphnia magna]|uniref:Uncharacterized protein n=1 Tax=Daphnia magna TaxID=35525 RepID=A0ABQ9ZPQ4_9CRUS|nr:hypothetical protein OUZ56_027097 [Daphnia magna]